MQLSTIFQLFHGVSFIGGGNRSTRRELAHVTDKLDHIMYRVHLTMSGIRTPNVSGDRH